MELLEREPILQELTQLLRDATHTGGRLVAVCGEAGVGKSAVVDSFVARTPARHLRGLCDSLFTPRPLGPLLDLVHQSTGPLRSAHDANEPRDRLFRAFLEELENTSPVTTIIFEDVHWADEATLDLLKFAGRRIAQTRGLLIITYRDDEVDSDHRLHQLLGELPRSTFRRINLPLLSEAAVDELAQRAARPAEGLRELTGGNPFFVTEILAARGDAVPISIREAVLARASRLSAAARRLLDLVSLVPGRTERWLLERLHGQQSGQIAECAGAGMLVPTVSAVAFRHELARRAWESTIEPADAAELHLRLLDALLERAISAVGAARLVHHAAQAGAGDQVVRLAPLAAREAAELGAHREAVAHYAAALRYENAVSAGQRAELLESYSYELHLTGDIEAAVKAAQAALSIRTALGEHRREGATLRWLSRLAWWQGERAHALSYGEAAIRVLEPLGASAELAMAYSNFSQLHMLADDDKLAIHWGRLAMDRAEQTGDRTTYAHALLNVSAAELTADWNLGLADAKRALSLAVELGVQETAVRAHTLLTCQCIIRRDYALAEPTTDSALRYAREHDIDAFANYLLGWRAQMKLDRGEWAGAERDAAEVLEQPHVGSIMSFPARVVAASLSARRGDEGALAMLDDALAFANRTGELQRIAPVAAARAEMAWLAGDADTARAVARAGYDFAEPRQHRWYRGPLAFWLWRAGGLDRVPENIPEPYRLQMIGDWRAAADAWRTVGCPYERALALADGDPQAVREAFDILEVLGARGTIRGLRTSLRKLGVRVVPRGPRQATRNNPAGLTSSQMKVLRLLARGLQNSEIARELFLSPRTVDHHVSAILAKLGVHARAEAANAARGKGLLV